MRKAVQTAVRLGMVSLLSFGLALAAIQPAAAEAGEIRLGNLVRERLRAGGPLFTPEERAEINAHGGLAG